ncbi:MAG: ATP-binding cassette domain-containing protein [Myxococcales bacterium]|nr:MAG: ATP-binding cassette domain-containing protein [Myxococcales bacterium]
MLSGGERARLALAKLLLQPINLMVLDEPTNDLDTTTLGALETLLVDNNVTALIVTHDRYFLDRVCTSLLAFDDDKQVSRYNDYQVYKEERALRERLNKPGKSPQRKVENDFKNKKALTYAERIELDALFEKIEQAEKKVAELEVELADPDFYATRAEQVPQKSKELEEAKAQAANLLARWEHLEAKQV